MAPFPISIFMVRDHSMEPALKPGDYVVANRWFRRISAGDIIVFKHQEKGMLLVKRVGSIDRGRVFALGDNKEASQDSRSFGEIKRENIIGKVIGVA